MLQDFRAVRGFLEGEMRVNFLKDKEKYVYRYEYVCYECAFCADSEG